MVVRATEPRRTKAGRRRARPVRARHRQVNVRVEEVFYETLEAAASQDRRSVPQLARILMEEGLRSRISRAPRTDDTGAQDIARLASGGGAFGWLAEEPELYDGRSGEPV